MHLQKPRCGGKAGGLWAGHEGAQRDNWTEESQDSCVRWMELGKHHAQSDFCA